MGRDPSVKNQHHRSGCPFRKHFIKTQTQEIFDMAIMNLHCHGRMWKQYNIVLKMLRKNMFPNGGYMVI